jgi:hypothetical protein
LSSCKPGKPTLFIDCCLTAATTEWIFTLERKKMTSSPGIAGLFDQHVARINRIVKEEFSGGSAIFDQNAWPMIQFRVRDANGTILSKTYPPFSIAELEEFTDRRLRSAIRRLCGIPR